MSAAADLNLRSEAYVRDSGLNCEVKSSAPDKKFEPEFGAEFLSPQRGTSERSIVRDSGLN